MKKNKITIGSRRSALAKLQAYDVASQLQKAHPHLEIDFLFKESMGDKNLDSPLWQMPEKGVFTKDLQIDLIDGRCDLVVHSWKDLPIEMPIETEIVATLSRADSRDMLLFKEGDQNIANSPLLILSSSPRRAYNLNKLLPKILPFDNVNIEFETIRGNVPTRIRKLILHQKASGLILAKAALDRLLSQSQFMDQEVLDFQEQLKNDLTNLKWMILPLSENPTAPAQGALAIEICKNNVELKNIIESISDSNVFEDVQKERDVLKVYGGGCHQKIGASVIRKSNLESEPILFLKGETQKGIELNHFGFWKNWSYDQKNIVNRQMDVKQYWPNPLEELKVFDRHKLEVTNQMNQFVNEAYINSSLPLIVVSRQNALPDSFLPKQRVLLWSAGVKTWEALARRGYWVNGSFESLGETSLKEELKLISPSLSILKLTHDDCSDEKSLFPILSTYKFVKKNSPNWPDWNQIKECFWMSSSVFKAALEDYPQLLERVPKHACGAGATAEYLKSFFDAQKGSYKPNLSVHLSFEEWWKSKHFTAMT